jgi:hypothetical protein
MATAHQASCYLHGTHPDEQGRLSRLNELLNDRSLRELALQGGERVLDVGCGLGQPSPWGRGVRKRCAASRHLTPGRGGTWRDPAGRPAAARGKGFSPCLVA